MSDSYLPDNEPRDILLSLEELAAKKLPHAPTFRKAADEITRLRAELAAVTAERDRMREALKPFAAQLDHPGNTYEHNGVRMALVNQDILDRLCRRARAALEGVTEPVTGDSNA